MKLKKWNFITVAGTIALGCIATSSVLTVTSCSFKYLGASATLLTIAGEEKIRATTGEAGNSSFTATDNLGNDDTDSATWSLINAPAGVTINQGQLSWTGSLNTGDYDFSIRCELGDLVASDFDLTLSFTAPAPVATSINVYGAPAINGIAGTAGSMQYTATSNIGEIITNPVWTLTSTPAGVSINNSGLLSWTASAAAGTITINCAADGLTAGTLNVNLTITTPKPVATSINVYGTPAINGIAGTAGSMQYAATNNNGETLTSPTWSITTLSGVSINNSGLVSWTTSAVAGAFTISCAADGLTNGTLNVNLTITTPKPTPTSINVYGAPAINAIAGTAGNMQYTATNNNGETITNPTWSITTLAGVSINNSGLLSWTNAAIAGTFTISCAASGLTAGILQVTLNFTTPKPAATSINVYGAPTINGIAGTAGNMQYTATNNNGETLTSPTWSITTLAGVSINNSGLLSWATNATAGTFTISCAASGLTTGTLSVTLTITTPKPDATSINVYGAPTINGIAGTAGNMQYTATDNNGETLTSPTWSITTLPTPTGVSINNSGLLSWTASVATGTFTINCAATGLTSGTLQITLNIATPKPAATYIIIYGTPTINVAVGTAGSMQYTATDNSGETLTSPTWSITTLAGVSINNSGLLSWTNAAIAGTFTISCAASGLITRTLNVTLNIIGPPALPKPIPFTNQYFTWTISGDELTVTGLQSGVDLSNYDTLSIPATYTDSTIGTGTYSITAIGANAFNDVFNTDGYDTIINLDLTTSINLNTIYNFAFYQCSGFTGSLVIPGSIRIIGAYAFDWCVGFTRTLAIPDSVTSIGSYAFDECDGFTGLTLGNSVTSIGAYAFAYCMGFTGPLTIPNSVTAIGAFAFILCWHFTGSLTIPNSVTIIGDSAFGYCDDFTGSLTIGNSVTSIGNGAFEYCAMLNGTLTIPDSVTSIGESAFEGCSRLEFIDVSSWDDIPTMGSSPFAGFNAQGGTVWVPANYTQLGISLSTFEGLPSTWELKIA